MDSTQADGAKAQVRAAVYARLSEAWDEAESVPTQLERGSAHAARRGWELAASFKDDGFSAFKEITRDGFAGLIAAIEAGQVDVVIVRDIDRLTRNLTDWNQFEKACVRHGVTLSPYTGGDLDLSTPEGAYYGGMETLRAKRESAVKSVRVREGMDRSARAGKRSGGGYRWFGYVRVYADPGEKNPKKRRILREDLHPVEAEAIRDAARRLLEFGETTRAILKDWTRQGILPVAAPEWTLPSFVYTMTSPRIAGLREWQGELYPAVGWPAIIDADTHERLVRHFSDPARRQHMVRTQQRLLGGIVRCPKCGHKMYFKPRKEGASSYACANGPGRGCGGVAIIAQPLEEYVTGAVLDALESPHIQQALREGTDTSGPRRAELLADIKRAQDKREEARQDYSADRIDRADWLDIRDRTEERIKKARREYDRLAGSVTVLGDIPPAEDVRVAWESWNTDRRRAAIKTVLNAIVIHPHDPKVAPNSIGRSKDPAKRAECNAAMLRQRVQFDWRV